MDAKTQKCFDALGKLCMYLPGYISENSNSRLVNRSLLDLIDSLDSIEMSRTGQPMLRLRGGYAKQPVIELVNRYKLTPREGIIARYLANHRSASYKIGRAHV